MLRKYLTLISACLWLLVAAARITLAEPVQSPLARIDMLRDRALSARLEGESDLALGLLNQAVGLTAEEFGPASPPVADLYFEMGLAAAEAKKFQRAESLLKQAIEINPYLEIARVKLADVLRLRGKLAESRHHAETALALNIRSLAGRRCLAFTLRQLKDPSAASHHLAILDTFLQEGGAIAPHRSSPRIVLPPQPLRIDRMPDTKASASPARPAGQKSKAKPKAPSKNRPARPRAQERRTAKTQAPAKDTRASSQGKPSVKPESARLKPAKGGLIPPPPPLTPVYPSPALPGASQIQLRTEAKIKPQHKEEVKPDKPAGEKTQPRRRADVDDPFLLDWANDL